MSIRGEKNKKMNDDNKDDIKIISSFWNFEVKWICRCLKNTYILPKPHCILFIEFIFCKTVEKVSTTQQGFFIQSFEVTIPFMETCSSNKVSVLPSIYKRTIKMILSKRDWMQTYHIAHVILALEYDLVRTVIPH